MLYFPNMSLRNFSALAAACCALTAGGVRADQFEFTYTFSGTADSGAGTVVTGTFDGAANGDLITGITNAAFTIDGVNAPGPIYADGFAGPNNDTAVDGTAVLSFDGLQNAFIFADVDIATAPLGSQMYQFNSVTAASPPGSTITFNFAIAVTPDILAEEFPLVPANWAVTDLGPSPVPDDGGTATLLGVALAGTTLLGAGLRRIALAR
jgi:hypothetical protein